MRTQLRNIGIVAHVDAGKTTTTENMLHASGKIRTIGRVDDGTAQTDWLDVERERGISVRAATTSFSWQNCLINLIDTPGHVDFSAEVERALRVLDGAVLIVSAVEGVQAHTETIWHALNVMGIPSVIYVNKMDRLGASYERVCDEIRQMLSGRAIPIQLSEGSEEKFTGVRDLLDPRYIGTHGRDVLIERLAELDDDILGRYLAGEEIGPDTLKDALRSLSRSAAAYPVLFGSSKLDIGTVELLDGIVDYLPPPEGDESKPMSGLVFKIERDESVGRLAFIRLYDGKLTARDVVKNSTRGGVEKVALIRRMHVRKHEDIQSFGAGDIAAVVGLNQARIGDILGSGGAVPQWQQLCVPLLQVQVKARDLADYPKLAAALQELDDEDPLLGFQWVQETRELSLNVMGTVQIEILTAMLRSRFGVDVQFDKPSVIYRETPASSGEGFEAYTMPKPCWAILRFLIEPGPRGSGIRYFANKIRSERLGVSYQNEVERRVPEALKQGPRGWEVTDLKVTLLDGEHHIFHTHPLDFAVATPMAIMNGLYNTGTILLEPILHFRLSVPEDSGGRALSDITQMRGSFDNPVVTGGRMVFEGELPLATSLDYSQRLSSLTKGRGAISTRFSHYAQCPSGEGVVREYKGVNPIDRPKYILWARRALGDRGKA